MIKIEHILKKFSPELENNVSIANKLLTVSDYETMLIIELKRDQHLQYKRTSKELIDETPGLASIYVKYKEKYYLMSGTPYVKDIINNFTFALYPLNSPIKLRDQYKLYKAIVKLCPKGTTRNAIIFNTHCGIIPTHISHLYNRIYAVEPNRDIYNESKFNMTLNKKNNCLIFNSDANKWLKEFSEHKYTQPGKKNKIGLALIDPTLISNNGLEFFAKVQAETIILFSESQSSIDDSKKKLTELGFDIMDEQEVLGTKLLRMKWRNIERTTEI